MLRTPAWKPLTVNNLMSKYFHRGIHSKNVMLRSFNLQKIQINKYSTKRSSPSGTDSDKTTTFPYFLGIGLLSYVILTYALTKVDKKPLRKNMTEEEFENLEFQDGLKRKIRLLDGFTVSVYLFSGVDNKIQSSKNLIVLDVDELKKEQIEENGSNYGPILKQYNAENKEIPVGIVSSIISETLKKKIVSEEKKQGNSHTDILIMNFPQSINETIKFEEKVAVVDKLITLDSNADNKNELFGYYDIVNKVAKVKSTKDIRSVIEKH